MIRISGLSQHLLNVGTSIVLYSKTGLEYLDRLNMLEHRTEMATISTGKVLSKSYCNCVQTEKSGDKPLLEQANTLALQMVLYITAML